jgi:nicotinate-nucleotide adenylyltransferase
MGKPDPDVVPPRIQALAALGGRIGLLGGSFNPAHRAHRHISLIALRRLQLDAVWWLVAPLNPLKAAKDMAPLEKRIASARAEAQHPDIFVSAVESELGTRYTVDTLKALTQKMPRAHFVWLMGGDSLAAFHTWRRWDEIAARVPIAVIARPAFTLRAISSPAAQRLMRARIPLSEAATLAERAPPAWVYIEEQLDPMSATSLRERGLWP